MRIFINANAEQEKEINSKIIDEKMEITFGRELPGIIEHKNFDAFFILDENIENVNFSGFEDKPVFINSVIEPLSQLQLPKNVSRINGWNGFLQRDIWEVVSDDKIATGKFFNEAGWKVIFVKDVPGMVAARVICMIINEAFYALKEKVSAKEEIDLAMKLGTNYPYGPLEWADKIGLENVFNLLKKLSENDERCIPSFSIDKMSADINRRNDN